MTQTPDNGFISGSGLLSLDDAVDQMRQRICPIEQNCQVALADCLGRILAEDLYAMLPQPPFDNSAVDGYAFRYADIASKTPSLNLGGRVSAGQSAEPLAKGETHRIFTGAPLPPGADTISMQEHVQLDGKRAFFPADITIGAHIRKRGEDLALGARALAAGQRLRPQDLALAASLGVAHLSVLRRPRIALFSTGNELRPPEEPLSGESIYDANRALLGAHLRNLGAEVSDLGILRDDPSTLVTALIGAAHHHDLILTSGGMSMGEEDHVKAAVEHHGDLLFWQLAIKPGKPVAVGFLPSPDSGADRPPTIPFIGLPGNPVSVFTLFALLVRPMIMALSGATPEPALWINARAGFTHHKKPGLREYLRVSLQPSTEGMEALKHPRTGAGALVSLTQTDGLMQLPEQLTLLEPGMILPVFPYALLS